MYEKLYNTYIAQKPPNNQKFATKKFFVDISKTLYNVIFVVVQTSYEKRRRERINNSLNELKNLLLESRKRDTACCSKLEKADILEMTVQYLKSIRMQQVKAINHNRSCCFGSLQSRFQSQRYGNQQISYGYT
ncbi:LOW QUALITY PROTEIN: transcription factor HES-1-like [Xenia sp. Carnegie-2017]|uniref:LOW QUALITY PROTEIN: transcription factor HES-1-like n=1 Tax=Xenia sp. Carnegie-2017 TaxID=2897299 RepID=UPI001F037AAF|nr:LOW QUALITY PROTEIN: transcription factor HES-1-like [Xenia sp. Carnegie-2017]